MRRSTIRNGLAVLCVSPAACAEHAVRTASHDASFDDAVGMFAKDAAAVPYSRMQPIESPDAQASRLSLVAPAAWRELPSDLDPFVDRPDEITETTPRPSPR
jgi:hypothetical protein